MYGSKGAGKSALYSLLRKRSDDLRRSNIIVATAENPTGQTVFRSLEVDPPPTELEFKLVWKLYSLIVVLDALHSSSIGNSGIREARQIVADAGLQVDQTQLSKAFTAVRRLVKRVMRGPESVESSVAHEISGAVKFTTKLNLLAADNDPETLMESVDDVLRLVDTSLIEAGRTVWLLYDRLDVAFSQGTVLEKNALRALFRAYSDMFDLTSIRLKIFVRSDIWRRLAEGGFSEASHLKRRITVDWDEKSLKNLVIRRLVSNDLLCTFLDVSRDKVLSSETLQEQVLSRVFPDQVEIGPNKPKTFGWILRRTADGTGNNAPREIIQLLDSLRKKQIARLEQGGAQPESEVLFDRTLFKPALADVSTERYEQTFLAEFPQFKVRTEALRGRRAEHNPETLGELWGLSNDEAGRLAEKLFLVGFFERRGQRPDFSYRVPFVYWPTLEIVQGRAF